MGMEFKSSSNSEPQAFTGWTLVVPGVTVGNVGQLAVDLLLRTSGAPLCGYLSHEGLLPFVGVDPLGDCPGACATLDKYFF